MQETWVRFLSWEDPLEKEMATHSGTLAWTTARTEEPGRLLSIGSKDSDTTERLTTTTKDSDIEETHRDSKFHFCSFFNQ